MSGVYHCYCCAVIVKVVKQLLGGASTGNVLSHKEVWQAKANGTQ